MRLTHNMYMETGDNTLARNAQQGDEAAFAALVGRHYDLIYRLSFRMLGRREAAQDLAQDICASLPGKLVGFQGDARFTTWLYRVVSNAALDRIRKQKTRRNASETWGEIERMSRATETVKRDEINWLQQAMTRLSPDLRQTVALVLGEELTHAETAQVLDISEGTVSWRMSEVKKALKSLAIKEERIK